MKKLSLSDTREFTEKGMKRFFLVQNSPYFKMVS
jgi:hypothetical protein